MFVYTLVDDIRSMVSVVIHLRNSYLPLRPSSLPVVVWFTDGTQSLLYIT